MTFGLRNAAQSFQRFLDSLFRDLPYCFVYIDDILIASRNLDEHISHLKEIFRRLDENGLVLKISKCIFAKPEVEFLGHHVSASGIRSTTERIQAILDFNRSSTVKQLRRFLGMLNFYRRFLPNAAKHQTKLNDFLVGIKKNKNKSIDWDEDSIKTFEYCKEQLSESTTLAHPVSNAHFAIIVDASDNAVGGVMQQYVSNHRQLLVFFSVRLTPTQKSDATCYQSLPTVLLGLRTTIHEYFKATSAELIFGENLRLPGDFLHDSELASPSSFVQQLRNTFSDLPPVLPSHYTKQKPFIFRDLATCTHVFVRTDSVRTSLQPSYEGPYPVIKRYAKYFDISIKGVSRTISIDRLKPCIFADPYPYKPTLVDKSSTTSTSSSNVSTPHHSQQSTSEQSSKLRMRFAEPPAQYVSRSGRAVHPSKRFL
ncbi:hypothetical protein TNCT_305961 [Trichonephila clavata]|uniref:Reverse transcriptase domain-containing protein n=1 Tax=Trichonephila clavata TaxID=2740835 RepID=A0A8X6KZ11_TRICU|nr:hypothetical protein TNCT_305961 [Trichonephila clavata]